MKHITKRPFEIYLPGTKTTAPRLLKTIEVEVENRFGHEVLTLKSRKEIERIRTRAMGLMSGEDARPPAGPFAPLIIPSTTKQAHGKDRS